MYANTPTAGVPLGAAVSVTVADGATVVAVAVGVAQLQQGRLSGVDDSQWRISPLGQMRGF
jgi:hypothetical protein